MGTEETKKIVKELLEKGILVSPSFLEADKPIKIDLSFPDSLLVVNEDNYEMVARNAQGDWKQFDVHRTEYELSGDESGYTSYLKEVGSLVSPCVLGEEHRVGEVEITFCYEKEPKKYEVGDFVRFFSTRYKAIERILRGRHEMAGVMSINRVEGLRERTNVCIIGLVGERQETKNGNLLVTIEDPSGSIRMLVNKNNSEIFSEAADLVFDEVIGVLGVWDNGMLFAERLIWPDVPTTHELKRCDDDVYALFLSDVHVGSKQFLEEPFLRFIKWLKGESGSEQQREIAKKTRYIFISGDLVDGVGIYPSQEEELTITDIKAQYDALANYLAQVPKDIEIIMCPGNHDALRLAEPQPPLNPKHAQALYDLPNVTIVSNPGMVTVHKSEKFSGFDVLLYHGYSFDYYVANVDSIRHGGGYHRGDLIMKYLLRRRHLAPAHTSSLYIPDAEGDSLVINKVPDFFATGHIHYSVVANYRNVTMICGSCWQDKTPFQEKMGHDPEPARVPAVNLKTRKVKILRFM